VQHAVVIFALAVIDCQECIVEGPAQRLEHCHGQVERLCIISWLSWFWSMACMRALYQNSISVALSRFSLSCLFILCTLFPIPISAPCSTRSCMMLP